MSVTSHEIIAFFSDLIEKETGIRYDASNSHLLDNRLIELAKTMDYADVGVFWKEVKSRGLKSNEREMVLDLATNNETSFFRDPEVFDFFRNEFVPNCTKADSPIRIWSAACSTGQEPYSLAIVLAELRETGVPRLYEMLVSDFSQRVLNHAQSGVYSQLQVQRGLPSRMLVRYFEQVSLDTKRLPMFKIKPELARSMSFRRINLLEPWTHQGSFDIVFCRNVLIYQNIENKRRVIARIANCLSPGGYLILGGAESLVGLSTDFTVQIFGKACVYRLKPSRGDQS